MEFNVTVVTLAIGSMSLFVSGWFFGRQQMARRQKTTEQEVAESSVPSVCAATDIVVEKNADPVSPRIAELDMELDIAREEIRKKDQYIEELHTNTNRLGKRILEMEAELQAKEEELREVQKLNSPRELLDNIDPFMDALQKESDQLRAELENAYRLINRQELELSRLRSSSVDFQPEETEVQLKLQKLEEELAQMQRKCAQYEAMLLEAGTPPGASMADSQSFVPPLLRDSPKHHDNSISVPEKQLPETTKPY